jgi:hypothetical protein
MSRNSDIPKGLADAIEVLREELTEAITRGEGKDLAFRLETVEVDLGLEAIQAIGANAKLSFAVLGVGGEAAGRGDRSLTSHHRVKITLRPDRQTVVLGSNDPRRPD